jgi:hypothetical protein
MEKKTQWVILSASIAVAVSGFLIAFPFQGQVSADHDYWHTFITNANSTDSDNNATATANTTSTTTTTTTTTANNTTPAPSTSMTSDGSLDCAAIASELGGIGIPSGKVCDVVVVRQTPNIMGDNGLVQSQFTLMNSVLEFLPVENDVTGASEVYVMGDFALLETEMNDVLGIVKANGWTVTGIHNHMINETPKTSFMHWEVQGDLETIIEGANEAFTATSIKG